MAFVVPPAAVGAALAAAPDAAVIGDVVALAETGGARYVEAAIA
jgi:hypothetical protein